MSTAAIGGGLLTGLLGGLSGLFNPRPPSLSPVQQQALNSTLPTVASGAIAPLTLNPQVQQTDYAQIAQSLGGANDQATHALAARGLGRSGLLANALIQNAGSAQTAQNAANQSNLALSQQTKLANLQALSQLLNVNNTPGQSGFGGFMAGLAPLAAYSIQNGLNNNATGGSPFAGYGSNVSNPLPTAPTGIPTTLDLSGGG
jgi:hypothetical protein